MKIKQSWLVRGVLGFVAGVIHILSLPPVRNYIWGKAVEKSEKKIVDAQAKVVGEEKNKRKKKRGLFRR